MPQDSLKSAVYRSFVTCDDPRGVVECKPIRKNKTEPSKMDDRVVKQRAHDNLSVSSSKKGERKEMAWKGRCAEELSCVSSVQLAEVSKGAEKLNRVIDSLSRGVSFERQSKDIAKDLLKGALDLQESLVMLGKLQEASQQVAKLKKRSNEFDGTGVSRAKSERIGGHRYHQMEFDEKPRFSVDGVASGDCYEELREVIRESFARQNLLPPRCPVKRVSFECRELELSPDLPSTSSSQSSFEKPCFDRTKLAFTPDPPSTSSSQSSIFQSREEKPKGPNLIAKLMGLEEISSKPLQSPSQKHLEKDRLFNQRRPIFEIDLPKAKKPPSVVQKPDPKRKTLEEIIETMQLKGLLKSKLMDGSKHETHQHTVSDLGERFDDGSPPIVIMRPFYAPELHGERFYESTSPCFECASVTEEKVRRSRREDFLPKTTDWQKGAVNATFSRSWAAKNGQIANSIQEKGAKEHRETPKYPNENGTKVHAKLSSIKAKASDPGKPRQQKKEAIDKKLDKIQKVTPNLRKTEGMKNYSKVRNAAKSCDIDKNSSAKLRKSDTVPHISEKQQKNSTSDLASKRATAAASHNSRNKKNMKTDKPRVTKQVENKGDKDVQLDLISKKETYKTETKVEASEKLYAPEASVVYENHITDDQISDETLPCDSNVLTVACDINIESTGHEKSCTSPVPNEKTSSGASSATRSLLLSSASFLSQAEELFGTDAWQPAAASFKHENGMAETKLLLDCACELLNNKKAQCTVSFDPLSSKPVRRSRVGISLDVLVSEICEAIESLGRYKDPAGALGVDTLCSLTKKYEWCKGVVSGTWDLGWSKGFSSDEVEKVIGDIEKHLLCGIIEDTIADFAV
ncbi:uncharacterized protein LOC116011774 [Ipomoea triloba]|uniref:uncharacterized protein LOC116011774 n=1 Tax=Ipomoea triloba TaxID=35885 RepID=UPI00125D7ED3|nr:uncharacterized protein LOC116011774 [Ipomoea triloba]XP_031107036.1 uncharacterized protein LOC116011774 [Ipomoea triloba]XP_031107037.1 uncharacterized protein LOC116011774 [Ipomoea triloba]XP_031107038.1 uncharacterized protein LOC116011774 [Ipomoea triloba]